MKIAIIGTRGIPNNYGGFEQFAEYLSIGLVNKGHEVFVYNSHNHPYKKDVWNDVNIIHCYDPEYLIGTPGQFIYDLNCIVNCRKYDVDIILQLGYTSSSIWNRLMLKKSILVMHSPQDKIVSIDNAADIYGAAFHPKSFISLDGADHLLSNKADSLYAGDVIASWATRYLSITEEKPRLRTREQVVVQTGDDKFTTHIKMDDHMITADEPASVGGNDFGPSPYELLLAGLGACTSMTMKMYADRKGWEIDNITVHLSHEKRHADDYSDSENPTGQIDHIEKSIEIEGNIDEKQRQRLLNISKKCPVHRTLLGDIKIDSSLME